MHLQNVQLLHNSRNSNFFTKAKSLLVILVFLEIFTFSAVAYYIDSNPYRHKEILGPNATAVVEWSVNWKNKTVSFQVSAETKGWIGFGLSMDGRMFQSDVVIGGVDASGKPYFYDAHVSNNRTIEVDQKQDWKLLGAWEKGKRTFLSFTRNFDTCDPYDHAITKDLVVLIWAYGDSDHVQYHMSRRGSVPVYLLDPSISDEIAHHHYRQIGPHSNLYLVQRWALTNAIRLSAKPTSVWCSIHRGPRLAARHDIVGMGAFLPTKLARKHVQQMFVYRCTPPQQTQAATFFTPYTEMKGEECYINEKRTLPMPFCRELIYVWGRGGKPFYFPEDIGIPIGESQDSYFLLETFYDNPKNRHDLEIEAGVEFSFSHRQKPNSASILQIGYGPLGTFMIPPKSTIKIYGSCGSKCTSEMLPSNGVVVFAVSLHSRSLGRKIRLQHFRNGHELPWIIKDDNYDSEFQQMRLMSKLVTLLPGDQITTQCTFDSSERNRTSFSGFSTQDEACLAFLYISARIPFYRCTSEYPVQRLLSRYGIQNFTWDLVWQDRYVTQPKNLEGVWLGDVIDDKERSRSGEAAELQEEFRNGPQVGSCPNIYDVMGITQNQMFKTFTNTWSSDENTPLSVETPYSSSPVVHPQKYEDYHEENHCAEALSYKTPPSDIVSVVDPNPYYSISGDENQRGSLEQIALELDRVDDNRDDSPSSHNPVSKTEPIGENPLGKSDLLDPNLSTSYLFDQPYQMPNVSTHKHKSARKGGKRRRSKGKGSKASKRSSTNVIKQTATEIAENDAIDKDGDTVLQAPIKSAGSTESQVLVTRSTIPESQTTNSDSVSAPNSPKTSHSSHNSATGQPIKDFFNQLANMFSPPSLFGNDSLGKIPIKTLEHSKNGVSFQNIIMNGNIVTKRTDNIKLVLPSSESVSSERKNSNSAHP